MPARASYELKIEGILEGPKSTNADAIKAFNEVIPRDRPTTAEGELDSKAIWPNGFFLKGGYQICRWEADGYDYGEDKQLTLLSLSAEVTLFASGALYESMLQDKLLKDVAWFYKYKKHAWYTDLEVKLTDLNNKLQQLQKKKDCGAIELLRFREWKWYCGNGGGG